MTIQKITHAEAKPFIERWHYSGCVPTGKNIFIAWIDDCGDIYAVADYGIGVNAYQASFLARETGLPVTNDTLLELKRLCRREPAGAPLSQFIAKCHRLLKRLGYKYVVSFSDPEHGHSGGIYRASNFRHLGKTNPEWHLVDQDGNRRHRRVAHRYMERNGGTIAEARDALGLSRVKTEQKDRWFIPI